MIYFLIDSSPIFELIQNRGSLASNPRFILWIWGIEQFQLKPIFGYGFASAPIILNDFLYALLVTGPNLHSFWITLLVEQGLVGLFVNSLFYLFLLVRSFKIDTTISLAIFSSYTGVLLCSFFQESISHRTIYLLTIFLILFLLT